MNRSIKLAVYALFALLFPFWIFLGKITAKKEDSPLKEFFKAENIKETNELLKILTSKDSPSNRSDYSAVISIIQQTNNSTNESIWQLADVLENNFRPVQNTRPVDVNVSPIPVTITLQQPAQTPPPETATLFKTPDTAALRSRRTAITRALDELSKLKDSNAAVTEIISVSEKQRSVYTNLEL